MEDTVLEGEVENKDVLPQFGRYTGGMYPNEEYFAIYCREG